MQLMKINYGCHENGCFNIILEVWLKTVAIIREKYFPSFCATLILSVKNVRFPRKCM